MRSAGSAVTVPVLFKEFVLDERQIELARRMGASMVLLLVRALRRPRLDEMIAAVRAHGMEPVVEAADAFKVQWTRADWYKVLVASRGEPLP